jgi:hypothetical protein
MTGRKGLQPFVATLTHRLQPANSGGSLRPIATARLPITELPIPLIPV